MSEQMAGMAKSLERDAQMESVLRARKPELGLHIETGRQLSHDLASSVGIEVARGLGMSRSEEHTSELQSLMRISYAVFCLKKKKNTQYQITLSRITIQKNKH